MTMRSGTLLERDVNRLFTLTGFTPQNNKVINQYEIDVFVEYKSFSLIIECKQYERSTLAIRNLLHQWESKNRIIGATKVLFVLAGCEISDTERKLSEKFNIDIWDENTLSDLLDLAIKDKEMAKKQIMLKLRMESEKIDSELKNIQEKYNLSKFVAISYLQNKLPQKLIEFVSHNKTDLTDRDIENYINKIHLKYLGYDMRRIVSTMQHNSFLTKREAIQYLNDIKKSKKVEHELQKENITRGGTFNGLWISKKELKKLKLLVEAFDLKLEEVLEFRNYTNHKVKKLLDIKKDNPTYLLKDCKKIVGKCRNTAISKDSVHLENKIIL